MDVVFLDPVRPHGTRLYFGIDIEIRKNVDMPVTVIKYELGADVASLVMMIQGAFFCVWSVSCAAS